MAMFSKEYLGNKVFLEQTLSFNRVGKYSGSITSGAFPQPNGDMLMRLYIPGAITVKLHVSVSNTVFTELILKDAGDDIFEGTLPFDERMSGPANVKVYVNGAEVLMPDLPIIWTDNRPQNNLEMPDKNGEYLLVKDVPHGSLTREIIYSRSTGNFERCLVYTPSGYHTGSGDYPVLYLLHGGGDNESMWEYVGKMSSILDNLRAEKKAKDFIVVMMNGMLRSGGTTGNVSGLVDKTFEDMLLGDCIPFIEKNYRVKTDKWNRAIAGLSMGAYMSCDIGFSHPELFGSIGTFTASMSKSDAFAEYERPYRKVLKEGAENFEKQYKLYWRSTTPQENHPEFFEADDELLKEAGIYQLPCHHRKLYSGTTSKWSSWRQGFRDFAELVFR